MIYVGEIADIPVGESVRVQGSVAAIAVFNVDGELYAIDDTCTHQDASLSDGWLEGCAVECPLHAACFDLRTGMPSGLPAKTAVRTHDVVVDGELFAIDDTCTHQDASLADGWVEGCAVECPLHAACFDLRTGRPSGPPAKKAVRTHQVNISDGVVYVDDSVRAGDRELAAAE